MDEYQQPTTPPGDDRRPSRRRPQFLGRPVFWFVICAVILFLLLLGLTDHRHNQQTGNKLPRAASQTYQANIVIAQTGFTPATLAIKPGTQVTWTNTDSDAHQVAADPYPKNNSIPGFDSTQTLLAGDSYSFTFNTKGTYHVHDQINPLKNLATIIVK